MTTQTRYRLFNGAMWTSFSIASTSLLFCTVDMVVPIVGAIAGLASVLFADKAGSELGALRIEERERRDAACMLEAERAVFLFEAKDEVDALVGTDDEILGKKRSGLSLGRPVRKPTAGILTRSVSLNETTNDELLDEYSRRLRENEARRLPPREAEEERLCPSCGSHYDERSGGIELAPGTWTFPGIRSIFSSRSRGRLQPDGSIREACRCPSRSMTGAERAEYFAIHETMAAIRRELDETEGDRP